MHDTRPRTTPEAVLEDYRRTLDLSPEQRRWQIGLVCRTAMAQWWAKSEEERRRCRWANASREGEEILRRWAREYRDRASS